MRRKLSVEECKQLQLNILRYIHQVCAEHHWIYFLGYGSLLGAVRHQGFIPWDDDIDLLMPREDYRKLVDFLSVDDTYRALSIYHNEDYFYPYAKVVDLRTKMKEEMAPFDIKNYGVNIDIFPLDGLPDEEYERTKYFRYVKNIRSKLYLSLAPKCPRSRGFLAHIGKVVLWKYARHLGWQYWVKKVDDAASKHPYSTSQYVADITTRDEAFPKKGFLDTILLPFEGYYFVSPTGYDDYLTKTYGDYMKFPPKEQRVLGHPSDAWIEE